MGKRQVAEARMVDVLDAIARSCARGVGPSFREIGRATGTTSHAYLATILSVLVARGAVRRLPGRHRAIEPIWCGERQVVLGVGYDGAGNAQIRVLPSAEREGEP